MLGPDRSEAPVRRDDAVLLHGAAEHLIPCERVISLHSRQVRAPVPARPERGLMTGVARRVGSNRMAEVFSALRRKMRCDDILTGGGA